MKFQILFWYYIAYRNTTHFGIRTIIIESRCMCVMTQKVAQHSLSLEAVYCAVDTVAPLIAGVQTGPKKISP